MRRLVVLCIAMILVFSAIAFAEGFDVSNLSYDELVQLNYDVEMALFGKVLGDGVTIPAGTYTAGKDIPAGTYVVTVHGEGEISLVVQVVDNNGEETDFHLLQIDGDSAKIDISQDGMYFVLGFINHTNTSIDLKSFSNFLISQ